MQSTKARGSPKESPQKVSPRAVRQLKINPSENNSSSSSNNAAAKTPKSRSPKVTDRKSPRSPIPEKKRPSKLSELESQISQLKNDLKNAKDELAISESSKREAQEEAEQLKNKLADVSLKLEESQVVISKDEQGNQTESTNYEIENTKCGLTEAMALIESLRIELKDCKESEARAKEMVRETLQQLEAANESVDALRLDVNTSTEAYNSIVCELEKSRERVDFLEGVVSELNALKSEQSENKEEMRDVNEVLDEIKVKFRVREAELEAELKKAGADIEELKAKLMDKETQLQAISEDKEKNQELENEVKELRKSVIDKENELQNIMEENEILRLDIKNQETNKDVVEESKRNEIRVTEQLEAAQAVNITIEAELRRVKVQSDQWRKAAEAAASMLSPESESNGKCVERTGSMPVKTNYSPIGARLGSPFLDDYDEDSFKKKNVNVLKKIGVLWKKPHK